MNADHRPTALIADDEPLLAQALASALTQIWPQLHVLPPAGDGASAVREALTHRPDVLFLDVRMPGLSGLEAAAELADCWPEPAPFPALVFVTAYDEYAVRAFELEALDYLLKPVQPQRLAGTVARLQTRLVAAAPVAADPVDGLRRLLDQAMAHQAQAPLTVLQAGVGNEIHLVPVARVLWFEAADKYVRVMTAEREYLVRTPLKELLPRLDPQQFWQVHRGTVVRVEAVAAVQRDDTGRLSLRLHERAERLAVSRLHAGRFKAQ